MDLGAPLVAQHDRTTSVAQGINRKLGGAVVVCGACGAENPPAARFCNACGHPLTAPGMAGSRSAGYPADDPDNSSTSRLSGNPHPQHLAQKILAGRDALQGERKQVTTPCTASSVRRRSPTAVWPAKGRSGARSRAKPAAGSSRRCGDLLLQTAAHFSLGQNYNAAGDHPAAIEQFRQALDCLERDAGGRRELLGSGSYLPVHARNCFAWSLSELGDFVTASEYGRESVQVADEIGYVNGRMGSHLYYGHDLLAPRGRSRAGPLAARPRAIHYLTRSSRSLD